MISSASTLLLATLVFNAATVYGAPIRIVDTTSEPVARAEMSTPVQPVVARAPIVDVQDNRPRSQLGHITRRFARLVSERDEPLPEAVVAREPEPAVEPREHRYPRRVYHDFYAREPEPVVPVVAPVVESRERRYPRQVYHDFYVKREPATTIKETTKVVEKVTVLDTPADIAAFKAASGANSPFASPSGSSVTVSTVTSTSQTTTIAASGSVPTPAPTADPSASASPSSDAISSTASASATASASDSTSTSASPTSTTASGEPTPSASGDPKEATPTSSATSSAASGQPTDAPADGKSGDPKPAVTADGTTPPDSSAGSSGPTAREDTGDDLTEAWGSIDKFNEVAPAPIVRRLATSGASWASSVRRQLNTH